jgi:hypothetical protein
LFYTTTGAQNVAIGVSALQSNTTASNNTAVGHQALTANTTGIENDAHGSLALMTNTTGQENSAFGSQALRFSTTASYNTAVGRAALYSNTTGSTNTAVGRNSLVGNTTGSQNTSVGQQALQANTTGASNTAVGAGAASANTTSNGITAVGENSLSSATGAYNTAIGTGAGTSITSGAKNTIIGGFQGNQSSVDIRTSSTNVILSDGDGKIRFYSNNGDSTAIGHSGDNMLLIQDNRIASSTVTMSTVDNAMANGWSNRRWTVVYAVSGSINTSDENEKQDIEALSDAETRVATACKGLIKKYRWREAVTKKGDDARIHIGVIAQELKAAFEAEGLDAHRYGMFCSDTWWEKDETIDGVVHTKDYATEDAAPDGATKVTRLGVRYEELLAFIISAM